jgi:hypothetical protein
MEGAGVEMEDVELIRLVDHLGELDQAGAEGIAGVGGQAQGLGDATAQFGAALGIAAGEQHHLVATLDQFFGEIVDNPFCASIKVGWNTFPKWRNLGYSHRICSNRTARSVML